MNEKSLNELLAEDAYLLDMINTITKERSNLPRNDKQGAHKLQIEINRMTRERRELRPEIVHMRNLADKRENHSLWVSCIRERYGDEELASCFEWLKHEKRRRKEEKEKNDC